MDCKCGRLDVERYFKALTPGRQIKPITETIKANTFHIVRTVDDERTRFHFVSKYLRALNDPIEAHRKKISTFVTRNVD